MNLRRTAAFLAFAVCLAHTSGVLAQAAVVDARELDERLKRIERLLGPESLLKLFDEVESLRTEVRELRGRLEERSHTLKQIEQRQRELYLDVDQRLQRIESGATTQTASPPPQPAAPSAAPAATADAAATTDTAAAATTPTDRTPPAAGVDPFAEQQAYQSAFDLLKSGRYEDAAAAFQRFIAEFPAGGYADNAQYWLGETYYITRRFEQALQEFQRLVSTYPGSQKLTGALLKLGYTHHELGNKAEAERVLSDLMAHHPDSAAARLALKKLQEIRGQ